MLLTANRYADAWQMLIAVQRRSVPLGLYVDCEERSPIPGHLVGDRVISVRSKHIAVPGLRRRIPGYAVKMETTIAGLAHGESVRAQFVFQMVSEAGHFAWALQADRFDAYRQGHCLRTSPPA